MIPFNQKPSTGGFFVTEFKAENTKPTSGMTVG